MATNVSQKHEAYQTVLQLIDQIAGRYAPKRSDDHDAMLYHAGQHTAVADITQAIRTLDDTLWTP